MPHQIDHPHPTRQKISVNACAMPTIQLTKNEPMRARAPSCCENLGMPKQRQNIPERIVPEKIKRTETKRRKRKTRGENRNRKNMKRTWISVRFEMSVGNESINMSIAITYRNQVLNNCKSSRTMPNRPATQEWQLSSVMYGSQVIHRVLAVYLQVVASVLCSVSCCSCWCDGFQPSSSSCNTSISRKKRHSSPLSVKTTTTKTQ